MRSRLGAFVVLGLLAATASIASEPDAPPRSLAFEANKGQAPRDVAFVVRGHSSTATIQRDGRMVITLAHRDGEASVISLTPIGASRPGFDASETQPGVMNFIRGRDPAAWIYGVPIFGRVRGHALYRGVDVEYYASGSRLEYDFVVAAGTDASTIRLRISGGTPRLQPDGSLLIATAAGQLLQPRPIAYQDIAGRRRPVDVSYHLRGSIVTFNLGDYDRTQSLVIDPLLIASTFVGGVHDVANLRAMFSGDSLYTVGQTQEGSSRDLFIARYSIDGRTLRFMTVYGGSGSDIPAGMAVDADGTIFTAGTTESLDLPTAGNQLQPTLNGVSDGFLARFSADGTLLSSTYFGSGARDTIGGMALGRDIYVIGEFLQTPTFFPGAPSSGSHFLVSFDRNARPLVIRENTAASIIATGPDGTVYVAGNVSVPELATPGAFQVTPGNSNCSQIVRAFVLSFKCTDGYVAELDERLIPRWATYVRETSPQAEHAQETVIAIAIDRNREVIVLGTTLSASFPITPGALESTCVPCNPQGGAFVTPRGVPFVARLTASGNALRFSTFLNGSTTNTLGGTPFSDAVPTAVAVDPVEAAHVAGFTWNAAFPTFGPSLPRDPAVSSTRPDAFLTVLNATGGAVYSSRLGGTQSDTVSGVATSAYGTTAIVGNHGADFPLQNAVQTTGGLAFLSIVSVPRVFTVLDAPPPGSTRAASLPARGWAVDTRATGSPGIDAVTVGPEAANGVAFIPSDAALGESRSDVAFALGDAGLTASGFSATVTLPAGIYNLFAAAHSSVTGETAFSATVPVIAQTGTRSKIQSPAAGTAATRNFLLSGYAVDLDAGTGPGVDTVHVWAYPATGGAPQFVGVASYGEPRAELIDRYGAQFANAGFSVPVNLAPGSYLFGAHAHSTVTGQFSAVDRVTVTVPRGGAEVHVDAPGTGPALYQRFTVAGWAIDPSAATGSGVDAVHIWALPTAGGAPVFLGAATAFVARPDIAEARGEQFLLSGFSVKTTALLPGSYQVVTYAHSTVTEQFDAVDVRPVFVLAATGAVLQIETPPDGGRVRSLLTVGGYAFDPRADTGLGVDAIHVWVYPDAGSGKPPIFKGLATYAQAGSSSLAARFGLQFDRAGLFSFVDLPVGTGTHLVALFAHSTVDDTFTVRTVLVTVPEPQLTMVLDAPAAGSTVSSNFLITGWAIDRSVVDTVDVRSGVQAVSVYAYRDPGSGTPPVLVCNGLEPTLSRADVAAIFGPRFLISGFQCGAGPLQPGVYDLAIFLMSDRTRQFGLPSAVVRVIVQ